MKLDYNYLIYAKFNKRIEHILFFLGVSVEMYRLVNRGEAELIFHCANCIAAVDNVDIEMAKEATDNSFTMFTEESALLIRFSKDFIYFSIQQYLIHLNICLFKIICIIHKWT